MSRWPTNWDIEGFGQLVGHRFRSAPPEKARKCSKIPMRYSTAFRQARCQEQSGTRNPLRGDGYYSWDTGFDKTFKITERIESTISMGSVQRDE